MKFTTLFVKAVIVCLLLSHCALGQLQVTPSIDADTLVQSLVGPGISVSNAVLLSSSNQAGFFDGSNSNIGFQSGILLTTGSVLNAVGPNMEYGATTITGGPGYTLLNQQAGAPTYDRCVLQFNAVPHADTLAFNYVFASEEYPEFVCSSYNDVFGFFISGPNPSGPAYADKNVALIPGTDTLVAINSINPGAPGASFPPSACISLHYSNFYVSNSGGATVEYDGFTHTLTGKMAVVPGSTYTFKLAIADVSDFIYDSGIFLEKGSLRAISDFVNSRTVAGNTYPSIIEGCLGGEIAIRRNGPNGQPQTVKIATGGTAINGVDYTSIPDSIIIPAGQDSVVLNIQGFPDGIGENSESLIVRLLSPFQGKVMDSTLIYIEDSMNIQILPGDTTICDGASVELEAVGGSNFQWSPSPGLSATGIYNPIATPASTATYTVNGSVLACSTSNTVTISVEKYPTISMAPDTAICMGAGVQLNATITPSSTIFWSPSAGLGSDTIQNPYATPLQTTSYTLTATTGQNCTVQDSVNVIVHPLPPANAGPDVSFCEGGNVQLQATGGISYQWTPFIGLSNQFISNPIASPDTNTNYIVQVTDTNGCNALDTISITVKQAPTVDAGPDPNICSGESAQLQANGAATFQWSPVGSLINPAAANPIASPLQSTTYTVVGTAANGCTNMDSVTVIVHPLPPANAGPDVSFCEGGSVQLQASGGVSYQWTPATGLSNPLIPNPIAQPDISTNYNVQVTDTNGCNALDTISITVKQAPTVGAGPDLCLYGKFRTVAGYRCTWLSMDTIRIFKQSRS